MTQHDMHDFRRAHDFASRHPKDGAVLCFYSFVFNGEGEIRSVLDRMSEDERATVRHLAAAFYQALVDEEHA